MSGKILWELGEIYTAPLNFFLILLGMSFAKVEYGVFYNWRVLVFTITLLFIHIAVNIFNNYMDYQNAEDLKYKEVTNIIGREHLSLKTVRSSFLLILLLSFFTGAFLTWHSDIFVFILGVFGYYVGLGYSTGKHPINSLPIAESIPALLSGYMIPMMSAYLTSFQYQQESKGFLLKTFIVCMPMVICMFNNLLANNTCDLEEDIKNNRKTLVYYIGKKTSVRLLLVLTAVQAVSIAASVYLKLASPFLLLSLLFLPVIFFMLRPYVKRQIKKETFPIVLKAMSLMMVGYPLIYLITAFL
ncbi:prenyltransferase [Enterococcus sp. CWB-B31]|uniref:prenyltransferase n=1 Tax=Enterococcus sp. CWB-B31 TaxID=2885159 RepID=UPI001E6296D5|nr:prenyltransferase [Enterococcus sp. CWB-B31]MCB5955249.1 prenyltransferase [Enterococcus sp. CWB-B31]